MRTKEELQVIYKKWLLERFINNTKLKFRVKPVN